MDPSGGRDSRYNINYSMSIGLSMSENPDIYGNPNNSSLIRPPSALSQTMNRGGGLMSNQQCGNLNNNNNNNNSNNNNSNNNNNNNNNTNNNNNRGIKRTNSDCYDDRVIGMGGQTLSSLDGCTGGGGTISGGVGGVVPDLIDDNYTSLQKKSPPANGKKTKGRVKIKMEYIDNKLRRYTTFSKRKTGIMKKAYELSTLTGTQVMLLVASETGHVYTFATRKLQPMITSEAGKQLIQTCLNSPDPPTGPGSGDQRMSATGFEETELSYNIADEDSKDDRSPMSSGESGDESSGIESPGPANSCNTNNNNNNNNNNNMNNNNNSQQMQQLPMTSCEQIFGGKQQTTQQSASSSSQSSSTTNTTTTAATTTSTTRTDDSKNFASHSNNMNSVLYPASALANIPQDVLLGLVQAGHLQVHQEEDGAHQYITIPLSMMPGGLGKVMTIKDSTNVTNGRESPPKEVIIKKENIE